MTTDAEKTISLLLRARKLEERLRGLRRLSSLPGEDRWRLALPLLEDSSHFVAAEAVSCLDDCDDNEILMTLCRHFETWTVGGAKSDPGCHLRAKSAYLFGHQEFTQATEVLFIGLRTRQIEAVGGVPFDTAAHLRANCALALASLRTPDLLRDLALLLFGSGGEVLNPAQRHTGVEPRKAAAQAIVLLGDPAGCILLTLKLVQGADEEAAEVLQECMTALIELKDERATEFLSPFLRHGDAGLAGYAALMIARSGNPESAQTLCAALPSLSPETQKIAALALLTMRTEEADRCLTELESTKLPGVIKAIREARQMLEQG